MEPTKYDFNVWRGADYDFSFNFISLNQALTDSLVGSTFVLRSIDDVLTEIVRIETTAVNGTITFSLTHAQTRLFPENKPLRYEVERRIGSRQEIWLYGMISGKGGVNDD